MSAALMTGQFRNKMIILWVKVTAYQKKVTLQSVRIIAAGTVVGQTAKMFK